MQIGMDAMSFGNGPPLTVNGHLGLQNTRILGIVSINSDVGLRICVAQPGLQRLQRSAVLPALAPLSGIMQGCLPDELLI